VTGTDVALVVESSHGALFMGADRSQGGEGILAGVCDQECTEGILHERCAADEASGDTESIVRETWLLATVELAVASCGTEPPEGPAGLLSPHPLRIDPTAATEAAWQA
jgi:hypothetical protein